MPDSSLLDGKKVLIVDDEPDVLDVLEELLPMCAIARAASFAEAKQLLETQPFDIAILDIMGVNGYALLKIAREKNITAVMLTAHAFTPDSLARSFKEGAASYIPKEKMGEIEEFLVGILKAKTEGRSTWDPWEKKMPSSYFERKWGAAWQDTDKEFWKCFRESIRTRKASAAKNNSSK